MLQTAEDLLVLPARASTRKSLRPGYRRSRRRGPSTRRGLGQRPTHPRVKRTAFGVRSSAYTFGLRVGAAASRSALMIRRADHRFSRQACRRSWPLAGGCPRAPGATRPGYDEGRPEPQTSGLHRRIGSVDRGRQAGKRALARHLWDGRPILAPIVGRPLLPVVSARSTPWIVGTNVPTKDPDGRPLIGITKNGVGGLRVLPKRKRRQRLGFRQALKEKKMPSRRRF